MTKNIKIATGVNKAVELGNGTIDAISVWEIVKEHREILFDRLASDLVNYVSYLSLGKRATVEQIASIQRRLAEARATPRPSRYMELVAGVLNSKRDVDHIATAPVLQEVDEIIKAELSIIEEQIN